MKEERNVKKRISKSIAVLMCLLTAVAFMPVISFGTDEAEAGDAPAQAQEVTQQDADDEAAAVEEETEAASAMDTAESGATGGTEPTLADPIDVNITVSNQGVLAKANDGSAMAYKEVHVTDADEDGMISVDDALKAAHEEYCPGGYATEKSDYGISVTKLWGISTYNTLFFVNGKGLESNVADSVINEGDAVYASVNADNINYADWYTYFNKSYKTVDQGEEFSLNIKGFQGMSGVSASNVTGVDIGIWKNGEFSKIDNTVTDKNGNVTLSFDKPGEYIVTAAGSIDDTWTDWSGKTVSAKCPIMAPACVVTVEEVEKVSTIDVFLTVSEMGLVASDKNGNPMAWSPVTVKDLNGDKVFSYGEALEAAHEKYSDNGSEDYATSKYGVSKLWGDESGNYLFFTNNVPISTGVNDDAVKDGDYLLASINEDSIAYADWYSFFNVNEKTVKTGESFTLTLKGFPGMSADGSVAEAQALGDVEIGIIGEDGSFEQIQHKETDTTGKVTISFSEAGTYYVTASGSAVTPEVTAWGLMNLSTGDNPMYGTMDFVTYDSYFAYTKKDYGEGPYPGDEIEYIDLYDYSDMTDEEKAQYHVLKSNQIIGYISPIMAPVCKVTVGGNTADLIAQMKDTIATLKAAAIAPAPKASATGTTSIRLTWTVSGGVDGYELSRDGGKTWTAVTGSSRSFTGLSPATKYSYQVRGYVYLDGEGTDKYYSKAASASATTKLGTVSGVSVKSKSRKLTTKWSKVTGATSYQVYISTSSKFNKGLVKYTTKSLSKTSKKLKKGKKYYVKVRAYKNGVYGSWSSAKKVKCK